MKRQMLLLLSQFLCLLSSSFFSQQLTHFTHNEMNSDIGSNVCYNISQLPDGTVFVSNNSGLQRFDGKYFESFEKRGKGMSVSSSVYDQTGRLWANTFHGDIYYLQNDSLLRHPISDSLRELTQFFLLNDTFYLTTKRKIFRYNPDDNKFNLLQTPDLLIVCLFEVGKNNYALFFNTTKSNLVLLNLRSGEMELISLDVLPLSRTIPFSLNGETFLFSVNDRTVYRGRDVVQKRSSYPVSLSYEGKITYVTALGDRIAVCGVNGIRLFDRMGGNELCLLKNVQVTHAIQDHEGNYLVSSSSHGLIVIPDISAYHIDYSNYLKEETIISSVQINNQLVHGTNAGLLLRHDLVKHQIDTLRISNRSEVSALSYNQWNNKLYVYSDDLFVVDYESLNVKKRVMFTSTKAIAHTNELTLIGTWDGVYQLDEPESGLISDKGWSLSLTGLNDGTFLWSCKKGLYKIDRSLYVNPVRIKSEEPITNIRCMQQHSDGMLYCIANFNQLVRYDIRANTFEKIYEDEEKLLNGFFLTERDTVILYGKKGAKFLSLTKPQTPPLFRNRLQGIFKDNIRYMYEGNGNMYFVHDNAVSVLPGILAKNRVQPQLSFFVKNGSFQLEKGVYTSEFEKNAIRIEVEVANTIRSQGETRLFYRVPKLSGDWKPVSGANHEIFLERLPPGKYTIEFFATNEDGVESRIYSFPVRITPPFYLTFWFILGVLLVLFVTIVLLVRFFVRRANRKALERLQKQKLETRVLNAELTAIRSQMNPHFIFNVLTAIQSKVIEGKADEAYKNIGDFATLIRNVLDKSGKEFISLNDEITLIKNYVSLENSRLNDPIQLVIDIDDQDYFDEINIPTLITQPFVENSIKHGFPAQKKGKRIEMQIKRETDGFVIAIKDNGVGIGSTVKTKSNTHQSFALEAMKKRIQALKKTSRYQVELTITSGKEEGTTVTLYFTWNN